MVNYDVATTSGQSSRLWGSLQEYPEPPAYDYVGMRALIAHHPLVFRAYQMIVEGVRGASWRLYIPDREDLAEKIEEWLEGLWAHISTNAANAVFDGFQVCETWFQPDAEGWRVPQPPVFPFPETVRVRIEGAGRFNGFKQIDFWQGKQEIYVPPEKSIHWVYGGAIHNDPYGLGALGVIQQYAKDQAEALAYAVETSYRHACPLTFVTVPQAGYDNAGADAAAQDIKLRLLDNRLLVWKSIAGERVEATAIQPPQNAVADIMRMVDYDDRQIALGLLVALRTFYSGAEEGGSYSLVEVQRDTADQLLSGIIESLRPGFERFVQIILTANGYPDLDIDFTVEKPSELTLKAAREMIRDLIKSAGMAERLDYDRLTDLAQLNILKPEEEMVEEAALPPADETPAEEVPVAPVTAEVTKMARKVEIPENAREARRQLDAFYQAKIPTLEAAILDGTVKSDKLLAQWTEQCGDHARTTFEHCCGVAPSLSRELTADWRAYPRRMWTAYQNDLRTLTDGIASMKLRGRPVDETAATQRQNLAKKLASKALGSVYQYFTDLQRAAAAEAKHV